MSAVPSADFKQRLHSASRWIMPRPLGWLAEDHNQAKRHFALVTTGIVGSILIIVITGLLMTRQPAIVNWLWAAQLIFLAILIILLGAAITCVQRCFLNPLSYVSHWAAEIGKGNLSARVPDTQSAEFSDLASHLNQLGEQLQVRMEERVSLANELHDSLAQTIASLRFQVRVLDETLHQGDESATWQEMERVEKSLEQAHIELRELIAHFRAPIDKQGLIPAIEKTVSRFRQEEADTAIFFQNRWHDVELAEETEVHILRVIQEALANIKKHSQANTVRILLRQDQTGNYIVLIEDDGIGFAESKPVSLEHPGQHIGLSVMQERAQSVGAELTIESEAGEGTRILLRIKPELPELKMTRKTAGV